MNPYNEHYFMRGVAAGVSNYENYRWLPEQTLHCCEQIAKYLNMSPGDSILDFGCARGYYVRALRELGYDAWGFDISEWAIQHCDQSVVNYITTYMPRHPAHSLDWVLAKDVLEHIPRSQLTATVLGLLTIARKGVLIIVPLARDYHPNEYVRDEDNRDTTHEICWTLDGWLSYLQKTIDKSEHGFTVSAGYKVPGVKQAAEAYPKSTAFITLRSYSCRR